VNTIVKPSIWLLSVAFACLAVPLQAQTRQPDSPTNASAANEEGIPVQSELVRSKCGGCHRVDDKMRMTRISGRRATPENWERTIKRMVTLNHVNLEAADARGILKYLADHQSLAPEEARPVAFEAEHRIVEYTYTADKDTSDTCSSCHSMARALSERRTKEEWELLLSMHRGYYPLVDNQPMNGGQGWRRTRPIQTEPGPDGQPPDNRNPMDKALAHLTKEYPLHTPEWDSWSSTMQSPRLAGRWAISGYQIGKGPIYGQLVVTADSSVQDGFNTETHYTVARTGETVSLTGKAVVYAGFQWRGREAAPGSNAPWRQVMFVERDWREMSGRWFMGAYDEIGVDVKLARLSSDPTVFGTSLTALKTGTTGQSMKIYGANLASGIKAEDIGLGQGVKVTRVVSAKPDEVSVEVDVAANAPIGARDLAVAGAAKPSALVVYDKMDGIRVQPLSGMARVGGAVFPKMLQQFEVVGINNGPDGKPGTADDLNLGIIDGAKWSMEEYPATFSDDDTQFVGGINENGLFTPNLDGPNPKRSGNRDNVGDVWIVAELSQPAAGGAFTSLRARAHLLVTVPIYVAWFESEGGR
jgi:quinohemoprotein amine dehydrogenase